MTRQFRPLIYLATVVLLFAAACAARAPAPNIPERHRITGLFSSLHFVEDTGDVVGMEVFITYGAQDYWVYFQMAEGGPEEPFLVHASVAGNDVGFTVESVGTFAGTVQRDALVGKMTFKNGNVEEVRLPRRSSYWQ